MRIARALGATILAGLALGFGVLAGPPPAVAATPGLVIVGNTTYDVLPSDSRIAVSATLTATNRLKDTLTRRYYFRTAYLSVLPGVTNLHVTGGAGRPKVSVSSSTASYTVLKLDLGANLAAGRSTSLTLTYDLRDSGGAVDRPFRVTPSLVTFTAWAIATPETSGGTVSVVLPAGYDVTLGRGPLHGPEPDSGGGLRWTSGTLARPLDFAADVTAQRPRSFTSVTKTIEVGATTATVLVEGWTDDPAWREHVADVVSRGLPMLQRDIGVAWPLSGPLAIRETLVAAGGYEASFDPASQQAEISYAASDEVILHELAHAWFNGRLVADRWAAEGFASYYGEAAARELGLTTNPPMAPADPAAAIPLNAWAAPGGNTPAQDAYAYATSLQLARAIADRVGVDALRMVWAAAHDGIGAYQPPPEPLLPASADREAAPGPPDWRGLLDLLEAASGKDLTDLWRRWVVRPADLELLASRAIARGLYDRSVALIAPWQLPAPIRAAMRSWQFDDARQMLAGTDAIQARRASLEAAAAAAGLTLPDALEAAFEGSGGVAAAADELSREQATVDEITAARRLEPHDQGIGEDAIVAVGLLGLDPHARLADAAAAFQAGHLEGAYAAAQAAEAAWGDAPTVGRQRIVSAAVLGLAGVLLVGLIRQQRRR